MFINHSLPYPLSSFIGLAGDLLKQTVGDASQAIEIGNKDLSIGTNVVLQKCELWRLAEGLLD